MIFNQLKTLGILGLNNRIGSYILKHNSRKLYPLVDNKVLTAKKASEWGIAMPKNYLLIENYGDLKSLSSLLDSLDSFVIKPASGSQGNGIIVIKEIIREQGKIIGYRRSNEKIMSSDEIKHHLSGILSGLYSLSGLPDQAIIQERIERHHVFDEYCFGGIPDVRVIVFEGYPVMSMVRLPTKSSDGRANLHQGAVGAGLCMSDGRAVNAVVRNQVIHEHPDTHHSFEHLRLPYWPEILELAARCSDMVGMGYIGVDIVLTEAAGPILLELNARPGLAIQIANLAGLVPRLEKIRLEVLKGPKDFKEKVQFAREYFKSDFQ